MFYYSSHFTTSILLFYTRLIGLFLGSESGALSYFFWKQKHTWNSFSSVSLPISVKWYHHNGHSSLWRSLTRIDRWNIPNCTSKKKNIKILVFKLQQKYTRLCDQKRFVLRIISMKIIYSYLGKLLFFSIECLFVLTWLSGLPVCDGGGNKAKWKETNSWYVIDIIIGIIIMIHNYSVNKVSSIENTRLQNRKSWRTSRSTDLKNQKDPSNWPSGHSKNLPKPFSSQIQSNSFAIHLYEHTLKKIS